MTAPQENQTMVPREPTIESTRADLKKAAKRQPEHAPAYKVLSRQLRNYESGDDSEKAALWPEILGSVWRIKSARGR